MARKAVERTLKFPALQLHQLSVSAVVFVADAATLWRILQINQRIPDKDEGYQRALSSARADVIANYFKGGHVIPTALVVTVEGQFRDGNVEIPDKKNAGWVIDGQHRLAGAYRSGQKLELPVVAFLNLGLEDQIEQFVTINREAKGVPSSLYLDLLKRLPGKRKDSDIAKERAADLARVVGRDEASPFFGRIVVMTVAQKGQISLTNFVRKVSPLVNPKSGALCSYGEKQQTGIIRNTFRGFELAFPEEANKAESIFYQTVGFGAILNVLPYLLGLVLKESKAYRPEDVAEILKKIDYFDFDSWRQRGSGNAAETGAASDLRSDLDKVFVHTSGGTLRLE